MNSTRTNSAAGACALALVTAAYAAPAKKAAASAASTPPIATYWMDVSTVSGFGMGMMGGGGRPSMSRIMGMMNGGGGATSHTLFLRLA